MGEAPDAIGHSNRLKASSVLSQGSGCWAVLLRCGGNRRMLDVLYIHGTPGKQSISSVYCDAYLDGTVVGSETA